MRFRDLARFWTISRLGFGQSAMLTFLNKLLKVKTFEELRIPLAVTATDFASGRRSFARTLADPVRASAPIRRVSAGHGGGRLWWTASWPIRFPAGADMV